MIETTCFDDAYCPFSYFQVKMYSNIDFKEFVNKTLCKNYVKEIILDAYNFIKFEQLASI